jgi:16S rRNA (cytidine1402-2'-O)-methyltransferase
LYVVATPIGNLGDITRRAIEILQAVAIIAAEDTRHSRHLLTHLGIKASLQACHEHNEAQVTPQLIERMLQGDSIALISDAGTPLLSDPGFRLVEQAHRHGLRVVPIAGACAAIAALSVSGLATDRFVFEGFAPAKAGARLNYLHSLRKEPRTLVFYLSCHRLLDSLYDMRTAFGAEREATLAREISKSFETIHKSTLGALCDWVDADANQRRGEMVLVVAGNNDASEDVDASALLLLLLEELPVMQAVKLAAKITGRNKNDLYKQALELKTP